MSTFDDDNQDDNQDELETKISGCLQRAIETEQQKIGLAALRSVVKAGIRVSILVESLADLLDERGYGRPTGALEHVAEACRQDEAAETDEGTPSEKPSIFTPADEQYLLEVLTQCRVSLETSLITTRKYHHLPDLSTAISDALTGIQKAEAIVIEPSTYLE